MVDQESILVLRVQRIDRLPTPPSAQGRGRPVVYSERLFLKALVIMIVKHLATVGALLAALEEPRLQPVRALLTEDGRYPHRRPFERRLAGLPERLPAQIACLGQHLLGLLDPFAHAGRWPSPARHWRPTGASGIRSIATRASCRIPPLIPRPTGPRAAGMAGSTTGSCT